MIFNYAFAILFGLSVAIFIVMIGDQINEFELRYNDPSDAVVDSNNLWHLTSRKWNQHVNVIHKLDAMRSRDSLVSLFKDVPKVQQELLKNILRYHSFLADSHVQFTQSILQESLQMLKRACYAELFGGLIIALGLMIAGFEGNQWNKLLILVLTPIVFIVLDEFRTQVSKNILSDMVSPSDILISDLNEDDSARDLLIKFKNIKLKLPQSDRLELRERLNYAQELSKIKYDINGLLELLALIQYVNNKEVGNNEFNARMGNLLNMQLSSTTLLSELGLAFQQLSRKSLIESAILADDEDRNARILRNRLLKSFEDFRHALISVAKDSLKLTQFNADAVIQQLIISGDMDKMDNKVLMDYFVKLGNQQSDLK